MKVAQLVQPTASQSITLPRKGICLHAAAKDTDLFCQYYLKVSTLIKYVQLMFSYSAHWSMEKLWLGG